MAKCRDPGSNRGPLDLQSNALPTELSRLAYPRGLLKIKFQEQHNWLEEKDEVPPRFELGSLDSKSRVLTITPWDLVVVRRRLSLSHPRIDHRREGVK